MKPVAIFRFSATEGQGRFGEFLAGRGIPSELVALDAGARVPQTPGGYSGICMLGGPMSVNDPLPWVEPLLALVRAAVNRGTPVIGHCLGGQLLARALGGAVVAAPEPEIGWFPVRAADAFAASRWFGGRRFFTTFQWHYETFSLPAGAVPLLEGELCRNQAFCYRSIHLGLQGHIEMTRTLVETWCRDGAREIARSRRIGVQPVAAILDRVEARLAELSGVADDVYGRWVEGLQG